MDNNCTNVVNGTYYHRDTKPEVVAVLERVRDSGVRVELSYGDPVAGFEWGDKHAGYIGRSMGPHKVPLLIANRLSSGGPQLLDHCIVKIRYANKKKGGVLYQAKLVVDNDVPVVI